MNDAEPQENQILELYPVAAKRLAQYLIEKRDYENFQYIYRRFNVDFNKLHLKIPRTGLDERATEFIKKLYHGGIYIPSEVQILFHFAGSQYELFEFFIEQGVVQKTKRADLLAKMQGHVDQLRRLGREYQCPTNMERYFEFVRNTLMLQD